MPDFVQSGPVTTIHDLGTVTRDQLESMLMGVAPSYPIGLVLPVTASTCGPNRSPTSLRN